MKTGIVTLAIAPSGRKLRIVSLSGGRGLQQHLIDIGLGLGSGIEVIKSGAPGPFLVAVKETRLAIGVGMARKIMVAIE
jgi:Fe2+ transport system protein FeoA